MGAPAKQAEWLAGYPRDAYRAEALDERDALADAARAGDWTGVGALLVRHPEWVNALRPGSTTGYALLHQAAWHGLDRETVSMLLDAGAWRTLRTTAAEWPADIARARGHDHLTGLLTPNLPAGSEQLVDVQTYLHALITARSRRYGGQRSSWLPQVEPLVELGTETVTWCAVPGMYGGFALRWDGVAVVSESWCRVVDGSGQRHRVTPDGIELVADHIC